MKRDLRVEVEIPSGVSVTSEDTLFRIKGKLGEISRVFVNPNVKIEIADNKVVFSSKQASKREKAIINTYRAHFRNAFEGVEKGYKYKMRICSGHFPMNVSFNNHILSIKNFIGEKVPRTVKINPSVKIQIDGREILLEGIDKEVVGQAAANIEQRTRRPGFDRRIFQDGIFIVEKEEKEI